MFNFIFPSKRPSIGSISCMKSAYLSFLIVLAVRISSFCVATQILAALCLGVMVLFACHFPQQISDYVRGDSISSLVFLYSRLFSPELEWESGLPHHPL